MRAFIFSLDAFVAFTLALIAIYSLIFFSSVPSAYYYLLTQGHYLSRDSLLALSLTQCTTDYGACKTPGASILDNIVAENGDPSWATNQKLLITGTIGLMIPQQFGYTVEISTDSGNTWGEVYDSGANLGTDPQQHAAKTDNRKFSVATQVITFGYSGKVSKLKTSPYYYYSCRGDGQAEGGNPGGSASGGQNTSFGLITCGNTTINNGDGTTSSVAFGNVPPSVIMGGGDVVPSSDMELVKLTVYI